MDPNHVSEIFKTQCIIRNKFTEAYTNRLESERNVNQTLQPLVKKTVKHVDSANEENSSVDLNDLCKRLRLLISTQIASKVDHTEEINTIITKLHDLEILL